MERLIKKIDRNMELIGNDLREFMPNKEGIYFENRENCLKLCHIFNWTQSFFTGIGVWAYLTTKDDKYLKWINGFYDEYYNKVFRTPLDTMHDLGFLYSPYAVAMYNLTGDYNMKKIALKAADELAKRFVVNGGYIRAWGSMDGGIPKYVDSELAKNHFFTESSGLAIIDCMMNIPLLFWASQVTNHPYYRDIAVTHANTTKKYFIRDDYSICHAYRFDGQTGTPIGEANYCGFSVGSYWARGTAWAIYGYAICYKYTHNIEYLQIAENLSIGFIKECNGDVPFWDFRLPKGEPKTVDTSALAIALCGFYEILKYSKNPQIADFAVIARKLLRTFINYDENVNGILSQQNGQGVYGSYGDYFLVEALCKKNSDFQVW